MDFLTAPHMHAFHFFLYQNKLILLISPQILKGLVIITNNCVFKDHFKNVFIGKGTEKTGARARSLTSKYLQQPQLDQDNTSIPEFHPKPPQGVAHPSVWAIFCCFSKPSGREVD